MLEKLVHAGAGGLPPNQHSITITIPNGLSFEVVTKDRLPEWDDPGASASRAFGAIWARERRSAIVLVPSFVARIERNILINPAHPEAAAITHGLPEPVWWDERLFERAGRR
jgi:RES domain-containing protein